MYPVEKYQRPNTNINYLIHFFNFFFISNVLHTKTIQSPRVFYFERKKLFSIFTENSFMLFEKSKPIPNK